jgi:transporter family protein
MWIIFSILAALCWAAVNTVDKYILTKWIRNPLVPVIILIIIGLIAAVMVYFLYGFSPLSWSNISLALIAGIFYVLMSIFYFKALKIGEVSRVIPLFYLSPLFILIFAAPFLGEVFTPLKYLGIILLVVGAILISSKQFTKITLGKSFWWMMLCVVALSINALLTKHLLNFADYWTIFAYTRIGAVIGLIPIAYIYLPELIDTVRTHGKRVVAVISANESLNLVGVLFITIATSIGYVTLVNALSSIQPFFVLLFVVMLSVFYPSILKEELGKSVILQKLVAIILMFIGAILIT